MTSSNPEYKRILLKVSGELLLGNQDYGINQEACNQLARALLTLQQQQLHIALVIGGGNIFRGIHLESNGMERSPADQMGMLATLMNGIALQQSLHALKANAKVMSALECPKVAEAYNWAKANEEMNNGTLLIFVGGTGNPYFTTDSAAALRACEIRADLLVKATKVDGVYDKDPIKYPNAIKYETISHSQALSEKLEIMDATAIALCRSNNLPIFVFNMQNLLQHPELGKRLFTQGEGTFIKT